MPLSVPKFLTKAFAAAGGKTDVPITGADINNGRADYENGFPPVTRAPIAAGGVPPYGTDMNGVLFDLSSGLQYLQAGMVFPYSQDFANAIGGYDVGAWVTASGIRYVSTISGNSVPPPSAGWQALSFSDPTETARGMPLVATNAEVAAGTNAGKMVTPASLASRTATAARTGLVELATNAETQTGTDAARAVTPASLSTVVLGMGQSVVDVTSSRLKNTTYTNTTGRSIFVFITPSFAAVIPASFSLVINGVTVAYSDVAANENGTCPLFGVVPPGATYSVTSPGKNIASWVELR